jgi:type II secretory pathway component PulF
VGRLLTRKEEASFFHQLAAMLNAGLSLQHSLAMAGKDCRSAFQQHLQQVSASIGTGQDLATALACPPRFFDGWTLSLIRMAEHSGALATICQQLALVAEQNQQRDRLYRSLGLATIALTFSLFALLTALVQRGTQFLTNPGFWFLGLLLIGIVLASFQAIRSPQTSPKLRQMLGNLPVLGKILQAQSMLYLSELALPLQCGVSMLAAIELVRGHVPDPALRSDLAKASRQIRAGHTLSHSLQGNLPSIAQQLIQTGEQTGNLDGMLQKLAEYYEGELERLLRQLQGLVRPLSNVAMGAIVLLAGIQTLNSLMNALPD